MDKNIDYGPYANSFVGGMPNSFPPYPPEQEQDPFFNPMMQYEQGYMYYRYLSQQMEYKIRCKEYEKLCEGKGRDKVG